MNSMLEWYDKKIKECEARRVAGLSICDDAVVKISEQMIEQYKELKVTLTSMQKTNEDNKELL